MNTNRKSQEGLTEHQREMLSHSVRVPNHWHRLLRHLLGSLCLEMFTKCLVTGTGEVEPVENRGRRGLMLKDSSSCEGTMVEPLDCRLGEEGKRSSKNEDE